MEIWTLQGIKRKFWKREVVRTVLGEKSVTSLLVEIAKSKQQRGEVHLVFDTEEERQLAQAGKPLFDVDDRERASLMLEAAIELYALRCQSPAFTTILNEDPNPTPSDSTGNTVMRLAILIDKRKNDS